MYAVPPIIMFLNKHPMAAKADLSSLRRVVSGAAPLGHEMVEEFHSRHPSCSVGQGEISVVHPSLNRQLCECYIMLLYF